MNFGDLLTEVYRIGDDPGQLAWPNKAVALHARRTFQRIGSILGDWNRISLGLVQSQDEYELPAGVRRVEQVQILPEGGEEPRFPIVEVPISQLPVITQTETDPTRFSLKATSGSNAQQFSIKVWPAPARTTANAIVIDIENDYSQIVSDNPATGPQLALELPFPGSWDLAVIYGTLGSMLTERSDPAEKENGAAFIALAEQQITDLAPINTTSSYVNLSRAFP